MQKQLIYITSFALLMTALPAAQASCVGNAGSLPVSQTHSPVRFAPININVPNGTVLATADVTINSTRFRLSCTSAVGWINQRFSGTLSDGIYSTNHPGIGYRHTLNTPSYLVSTNTHDFQADSRTVRIELVKTGHIFVPSLINIAYYLETRSHVNTSLPDGGNLFLIPLWISTFLTAEPRPTCALTRSDIPVDFGVVPISATNGQLVQRTVPLGISCSGGTPGTTRPVRITLTDAYNVSNRGSNLTIAPNDSGLYINLRYGSMLINFGPASSNAGNVGQFLLGNALAGSHTYNLTAHLMRNGPMRGLPAFSARATMTMRYE